MRDKCQALRQVLVPDSIWQQYRAWHSRPDDVAAHCSILLLAFRRGYLSRVTAPIHRYLVSPTGILPSVRKQYVQDFRERWMLARDAVERNRLSRVFLGRLVELQFAVWLEDRSHSVVGLEATREGPDIETLSPGGVANTFEVKFIGVENGDFRAFLKSIAGLPAGGSVSPYTPIDYLLFRAYEGARQLRGVTGTKTVVIVIDHTTWLPRFEKQLSGNWINWKSPGFLSQDNGWTRFIAKQQRRYSGLPDDLATTLQEIDSVMIFQQTSALELRLEYDLRQQSSP